MQWHDAYSLRARLAPALLAIVPAQGLVIISVPWDQFSLPQSAAASIIAILFVGASDLARRRGKKIEKQILKANGGRPMATALRHRDPIIDPLLKKRYLEWLGLQLQEAPPTLEQEIANKTCADGFYSRCSVILRDRTRDSEKFKLVFEENIVYGFRRNLLGLKGPTLALNAFICSVCGYMLGQGVGLAGWQSIGTDLIVVLVLTCLHSLYFLLFVTRKSVIEAADQYGRQLVLSIETLISNRG